MEFKKRIRHATPALGSAQSADCMRKILYTANNVQVLQFANRLFSAKLDKRGYVEAVAISLNGQFAVYADGVNVTRIDLRDPFKVTTKVFQFEDGVDVVAVSNDGEVAITANFFLTGFVTRIALDDSQTSIDLGEMLGRKMLTYTESGDLVFACADKYGNVSEELTKADWRVAAIHGEFVVFENGLVQKGEQIVDLGFAIHSVIDSGRTLLVRNAGTEFFAIHKDNLSVLKIDSIEYVQVDNIDKVTFNSDLKLNGVESIEVEEREDGVLVKAPFSFARVRAANVDGTWFSVEPVGNEVFIKGVFDFSQVHLARAVPSNNAARWMFLDGIEPIKTTHPRFNPYFYAYVNPLTYTISKILNPNEVPYYMDWQEVIEPIEPIGEYDPTIWAQFNFNGDYAIDEVTGAHTSLAGSATMQEGKLITDPPSPVNYMASNHILFEDDEDFYIRASFNMPFSEERDFNTILGVWASGENVAWILGRNGSQTTSKKMYFSFKDTSETRRILMGTTDVLANTDYTVEVVRVNKKGYLFLNGKLDAGPVDMPLGNSRVGIVPMRTDTVWAWGATSPNTHSGGGKKWDIQIKKGSGIPIEDHVVKPLEPYVPNFYKKKDEADALLGQWCFRNGSLACEKHGTLAILTNATQTNGRVSTTHSPTSTYVMPLVGSLGAGDFTIECKFNVSQMVTEGVQVISHWHVGGVANEHNRWAITPKPNGSINFVLGKADTTYHLFSAPAGTIALNQDHHAVMERVGSVVSYYIDGVKLGEMTVAGPLWFADKTDNLVRSYMSNNASTAYGARKVWDIRIANKALYNGEIVKAPTLPRIPAVFPPEEEEDIFDPNGIFVQFRFENGEAINEVTETLATLSGNVVVQDGKLLTPAKGASNYMLLNPITFGDNEDFSISVCFQSSFVDTDMAAQPILNSWENVGSSRSAWIISRNATSKVAAFQWKNKSGEIVQIRSTTTLQPNKPYHVEASRVQGIIRLFVNGKLEAEHQETQGFSDIDVYPLKTNVTTGNVQYLKEGTIWDIQIKKGVGGHTEDFTPTPLPPYVRPVYTEDEVSDVVLQLGFRRGSKNCEVTGNTLTTYGTAKVGVDGRLVQTNVTTSYAEIPISYFGAGDFTVEFMINVSALNSNGVSIGHWRRDATGPDTRWGFHIHADGRILFGIQKSDTANDYQNMASPKDTIKLKKDHHIVSQRIGDVCTLYVDGVPVASTTINLPIRAVGNFRTNGYEGNTSFAGSIWNIRIVDRALYH